MKNLTIKIILINQLHRKIIIAINKKNTVPINQKIRADKVMLIGQEGEKHGLVDFRDAWNKLNSLN